MMYGCIGRTLGHSLSPQIHARLGNPAYTTMELAPEEVGPFLQARDFRGLNVTIPYKTAVIPYLDELDATTAQTGAVNTIVNRNGRLYGYNTDAIGLRHLLGRLPVSLAGKTVLILGSGGTHHTAVAVCEALGAASLVTVSRGGVHGLSYEEAPRRCPAADFLLNTTPCGMTPDIDGLPFDISLFPHLSGLVDVIYTPLRTRLVQAGLARGIPAEGGLYMLVAQAVAAHDLFFDTHTAPDEADAVYRTIRRETESVVLIGMPGSGKTTLGRRLAAKTGRPFYDTDEEITRLTGRTPEQMLRTQGEAALRAAESRVIRELARKQGVILATGGGAVLCDDNVASLKQNGRVYLLDAPLDALSPLPDRPLADTPAKLKTLYQSRQARYRAVADRCLPAASLAEAERTLLRELDGASSV